MLTLKKKLVLQEFMQCATEIFTIRYEPGHEKMCLMPYANNKGADQPAHPHSLISAFVVWSAPLLYATRIEWYL